MYHYHMHNVINKFNLSINKTKLIKKSKNAKIFFIQKIKCYV